MSDVTVRFGGDASGMRSAATQGASAVGGLRGTVQGLTTSLVQMGEVATASFAELQGAPRRAAHQVTEVGERIRGVHEALLGMGQALLAVFAVHEVAEFAEKLGEAAEKIQHTAVAFGMTTSEVQRLQAYATASNTTLQAMIGIATRLDRALGQANSGSKQQIQVFKELGIDTGKARTQYELIMETLQAFSKMGPGSIDRVQMATKIFGRNLSEVAGLIGITKEQLAEYDEQVKKYGIESETAVAAGLALADALDENKNAWRGVSNLLTESLAPALTLIVRGVNDMIATMVASYQSGGLMKSIFDVLAVTIAAISVIFHELGVLVEVVWRALTGTNSSAAVILLKLVEGVVIGLGAAFVTLATIVSVVVLDIKSALDLLIGALWTVGQVIWDAMTGQWGRIRTDTEANLKWMSDRYRKTAAEIRGIMADAQEQLNDLARGGAAFSTPAAIPPARSKGDAFGKGGGEKDDRLQKWEAELKAQLSAEGEFFADSKAEELKFWQSKVALTAAGSKARMDVESKIYELRKSMAQEALSSELAELEFKKQMARDDYAARAALEEQKLALLRKDYGKDSRQYRDGLREKAQMLQQHEQDILKIQQNSIKTRQTMQATLANSEREIAQVGLDAQRQALEEAVSAGQMSEVQRAQGLQKILTQEQALETESVDRIYQIQAGAAAEALLLDNLRPEERARILDDLLQLETAHAAKMSVLRAKYDAAQVAAQNVTANAVRNTWTSRLTPIATAFNGIFNAMLNRTMSFKQAVLQAMSGMVSSLVQAGERWLIKTIAQHMAMRAVSHATAAVQVADSQTASLMSIAHSAAATIIQIAHAAALAAARAYAAIAGIPVVGPFLAPIAAAIALAAVVALGARIASAAGGQDRVPSDGQITELHKDEMVLSAQYANPLRALLSGANFGGGSRGVSAGSSVRTAGGNQGDIILHYSPVISSADAGTFEEQLRRHSRTVQDLFTSAVRNGWRPATPAGRPS